MFDPEACRHAAESADRDRLLDLALGWIDALIAAEVRHRMDEQRIAALTDSQVIVFSPDGRITETRRPDDGELGRVNARLAVRLGEIEQAYIGTAVSVNQHHDTDEDGQCRTGCGACSVLATIPGLIRNEAERISPYIM